MTEILVDPVTTVAAVDYGDVRAFLRLDHNDDQLIVETISSAATSWAQNFTRRQFITASYTYTSSTFPSGGLALPRPPLSAVQSVTISHADGSSTLLVEDTDYTVETGLEPGVIFPIDVTLAADDSVVVVYDAGYGPLPNDVPEQIRLAVKILTSHWYEHREPVVVGSGATVAQIPTSAESLLYPYKMTYFA